MANLMQCEPEKGSFYYQYRDMLAEKHVIVLISIRGLLSPSGQEFGYEFISSGLSAALGHELGPNGGSHLSNLNLVDTTAYLRIEVLS